VTTTREYFSADGFPIRVNLTQFTFEGERLYANRKRKSYFDLSGHHLSRPMCEFLITHCSSLVSATLNCYGTAFGSLLRFLADSSYSTLNGESFAEYVKWLKHQKTTRSGGRYAESTRRTYGIHLLRFMEWLTDADEVANNETDTARQAFIRAFKGYNARGLELLRLRAISPDEYIRLIRAARLEYETCKHIVNGSLPTKREYDITFPLLPFSILAGAQLGLRPVEFNYLTVGDLKGEYLALNPPNKKSSVVWLPPSVKACLDLAQKWMLDYRPNPTRAEPLLACPSNRMGQAPVRFDTPLLTRSLKKFYRKYFDAVGVDGRPCLYQTVENGPSQIVPTSLLFRDFRSAAITEAARHERNPDAVMRFARHTYFSSTLRFYIRETHSQWTSNIARFLAPSAELVRISLENRVASEPEERAARDANVTVAGGHCEQALSGDRSCQRATDCRLCAFFTIHASKREFFIQERQGALKEADRLQNELGLHRDAQNLREFAALNEAIINRIDEHLS
jgi:hypothetical protein